MRNIRKKVRLTNDYADLHQMSREWKKIIVDGVEYRQVPSDIPFAAAGDLIEVHPNVRVSRAALLRDRARLHFGATIHAQVVVGRQSLVGAHSVLLPGTCVGDRSLIDSRVNVGTEVVIGDNVSISSGTYLGNRVRIGSQVMIGESCNIENLTSIGEKAFLDSLVTIGSGTKIGVSCFIGVRVTIGSNCHLGAQVRIGAQTVIGAGLVACDCVRIGKNCDLGNSIRLGDATQVCDGVNLNSNTSLPTNTVINTNSNGTEGITLYRSEGKTMFQIGSSMFSVVDDKVLVHSPKSLSSLANSYDTEPDQRLLVFGVQEKGER